MKSRRIIAVMAALCLGASLFTGCSGGAESTDNPGAATESETASANAETAEGGKDQLNVALELFSSTLEPATDWDSWYVMRYGAGETLVRYAQDGSFEPWLAESWEVAEDGLTWTFHIRQGVKFSNGKDMTAKDVMQSIERLFALEDPANGGNGNPQGHFTYSAIDAPDDATLVIVTAKPTPDMPGCLAYPWTMVVDVEGSADRDVSTQGPICTGPYAFASFTQDSDVQMVKNQHYWDGEVPFERVNIMKVEDPATRAMALQDGSADMALNLSAADRDMLEEAGGFTVNEVAGSRTGYTHINVEGIMGNDALRQAVMMAVDGQTIAEVTTGGAYTYGYALVPSSLDFGYSQLTNPYPYDPEGAKQALDAAGILDTDGDGYRELDGQNIHIDYKVSANRSMDIIAQAQAAQLEAIGIQCSVELTKSQAEILNNHMFDIANSNEVATQTGDPSKFLKHWYSASDDNYSQYNNPEFDALYEAMEGTFDQSARKEAMTKMQQILLDDAQSLVYGYFNYNICTVEGLTGVNPNPNDFYWVVKDIRFA